MIRALHEACGLQRLEKYELATSAGGMEVMPDERNALCPVQLLGVAICRHGGKFRALTALLDARNPDCGTDYVGS